MESANHEEGVSPTAKQETDDGELPFSFTHRDYTVGWMCALSTELTAARAMLDCEHPNLPKPQNDDPNTYTLGSIGKHNIVIACLPQGQFGNNVAATVASKMTSTFPSIRFGLMVGVGGGIPAAKVRLGDVVVSTADGPYPGVVQWDMGKATSGGNFERTGSLNNPPTLLLTAVTKLRSDHDLKGSQITKILEELETKHPTLVAKYLQSDSLRDDLFKPKYRHIKKPESAVEGASDGSESDELDDDSEEEGCRYCDKSQIVKRNPRDRRIHYGLIASGNQVIKDAAFRDKLNKDLGGKVRCIEMEAAGLMNNFPCLIIRGICDYADSHKNKAWQEHAAAVAAAYAKELLGYILPDEVHQQTTAKELLLHKG